MLRCAVHGSLLTSDKGHAKEDQNLDASLYGFVGHIFMDLGNRENNKCLARNSCMKDSTGDAAGAAGAAAEATTTATASFHIAAGASVAALVVAVVTWWLWGLHCSCSRCY